ncbi:MAG: hypothetical protein A2Z25_24445 [Planctomycetes bacterium RBG_16_55_9]|nr:MAG: hypothetical protein A2Z25_24445 [Planctomycetes bacterium RBG_16_55_9]
MTERMEQFDEDLDPGEYSKLSADLRALFKTLRSVPPEVDRAVYDRIHRHFAGVKSSQGKYRRFRWAALWKVAAAAAVVIFAFSLDLTKRSERVTQRPALAEIQAADIDLNGRVDILDAFTLARQIEKTGHVESRWDMNGDGLVDRRDVDTVALAAVRLDKGVL